LIGKHLGNEPLARLRILNWILTKEVSNCETDSSGSQYCPTVDIISVMLYLETLYIKELSSIPLINRESHIMNKH
jgi:hypothetical protein